MRWDVVAVCLSFLVGCGGENEQALTPAQAEIAEIRQALEVRPDAPLLHFQLGQTYRKQGLADSARAAFEQSCAAAAISLTLDDAETRTLEMRGMPPASAMARWIISDCALKRGGRARR